ncbi:hypothetical protein PHLCEN_2v11451 [Hermanssonia centrifuga]|uniref:Uncharacterized protein n=1 Tax=Hermanssonia centrifuga TaxID=98765 RepID=A0A2R6NJZ0_9APHY|nr:hypothetical protein PHLCEN_2v11451 [Hermanssonia centrifuga]
MTSVFNRSQLPVKWDILRYIDVLESFQNLQDLKLWRGTYVRGWAGMELIGKHLGDRLVRLEVVLNTLLPPVKKHNKPPPVVYVFSKLTNLTLTIRWTSTKQFPDVFPIQIPSLSSSQFPVLASLTIKFLAGPSPDLINHFLLQSHLPSLKIFRITDRHRFTSQAAFRAFCTRHGLPA